MHKCKGDNICAYYGIQWPECEVNQSEFIYTLKDNFPVAVYFLQVQ